MAESADRKNRRRLDGKNLKLVKLKRGEMEWRGNVNRGACPRGSTITQEVYGNPFEDLSNYEKHATHSEEKLPEATERDLSLMNLVSKLDDPKEFFKKVSENIESLPHVDLTVLGWNMFGNKYVQARHVEFLISCCSVGEETRLDLKRMAGGGFAMSHFFTEVKNQLKKSDLIVAAEEDSVEFAYSEDDDDDSGSEDDNLGDGYLQLAYDPNIVLAWISKIQTRHSEDQLHMMGLMAYNASNKQNLDIIVKKGGKKLKALFIHKYENSNIGALVRFTSELAKHVTGHEDCKDHGYDKDFLIATLDCAKFWVPQPPGKASSSAEKNRPQSTKFEVTESKETVLNLIQTIYNLGHTHKIFSEETIVSVAKDRLAKRNYKKSSPKDDILAFLENQGHSSMPIEYFRHILKQI